MLQEAKKPAGAAEYWTGELIFDVIHAMTDEYDLNGEEMKVEVIEEVVANERLRYEQKIALAEIALQGVDDAVAGDDFDVAKKAGRLANQLAHLSKNKELIQRVAAKGKQVVAAAKACADVQAAMATLKEKPDDPDANLTVGKDQCFNRGNWEKGLPKLAMGSDVRLRALAAKDIAGANSPSAGGVGRCVVGRGRQTSGRLLVR